MDTLIKNRSWLSNSTYKPEDIDDYKIEEDEQPNNDILGSSDSSDDTPSRTRKKKKRKLTKIKKGRIIRHYINCIPTISDTNCEFRKYVFLEHMPKENRSENYFIDLRGNPHIGRYGCIYEKHVPKYRSKSTKAFPRYYEQLSKLKSSGTGNCSESIEKRLCDSRCVCQQSFIPIPFDVHESHRSAAVNATEDVSTAILNESLSKDPHNIDNWIRFIQLQSKSDNSQLHSSVLTERQLSVVDKALQKNRNNLQLQLVRLSLGSAAWLPDKLQREWQQLIFAHSADIAVWRCYIDQMRCRSNMAFSVDKVINIYQKCFSTFFNIMSGRSTVKTIDAEAIYDLCDLFADFCDFLMESGYGERATASWQAQIEYNWFSPTELRPRPTGSLLDDPMLQSFQRFWQGTAPLFGEEGARGWAQSGTEGDATALEGELERAAAMVEQALFAEDTSGSGNSEHEYFIWLQLEHARARSWWLPPTHAGDADDADRCVPFPLVQPVLITLHALQNLRSDGPSAAHVAAVARRRLLLLFFDHFGVANARLSLRNGLGIERVRWQQLWEIGDADAIARRIVNERYASRGFLRCSIDQLRSSGVSPAVIDDAVTETLAILQLALGAQEALHEAVVGGGGWKSALTVVRSSAKAVLATHSNSALLWIDYGQLLVGLVSKPLFAGGAGKTAVLREAAKVVGPLMSRGDNLDALALSIELVMRRYPQECGPDALSEIVAGISIAANMLAAIHSIESPLQTAQQPPMAMPMSVVAQLVDTFGAIMTAISAGTGPESDNSCLIITVGAHWHWALFCQVVAQALLLMHDLEKFQEWMLEECLLTITGMGSSCLWSQQFLYQLSELLESVTSFIGWFYRCQGRNECAILRCLLTPISHILTQIQSGIKKPIMEMVLSPRLIQNCIGTSTVSEGQRFKLRNFLWSLVASFEMETESKFNSNCQAASLLLLAMEINRLESLTTTDIGRNVGVFSGRTERVRSTFNRLIKLRSMHWRYRLAMWHSLMTLEASQQSQKRDDLIKGVFYRAVTEMPGHKSLYLAIVSLVPSMLEETTLLMKNNRVRMCVPVEEVKLLMRIRQTKLLKKESN